MEPAWLLIPFTTATRHNRGIAGCSSRTRSSRLPLCGACCVPDRANVISQYIGSMFKEILPRIRRASLNVLRFISICGGFWLAAVLPVEIRANARRAANLVAGHTQNMDPGVVAAIMGVMSIPILVAVLIVEVTRSWGLGHEPLALLSCVAIGMLAACPLGYSFVFAEVSLSYPVVLLTSSLGVVVFYSVRWTWLATRARSTGATEP